MGFFLSFFSRKGKIKRCFLWIYKHVPRVHKVWLFIVARYRFPQHIHYEEEKVVIFSQYNTWLTRDVRTMNQPASRVRTCRRRQWGTQSSLWARDPCRRHGYSPTRTNTTWLPRACVGELWKLYWLVDYQFIVIESSVCHWLITKFHEYHEVQIHEYTFNVYKTKNHTIVAVFIAYIVLYNSIQCHVYSFWLVFPTT